MSPRRLLCGLLLPLLLLLAGNAQAQIRLAFIDPLSGTMGAVGEHSLREFRFVIERINADGGVNGKSLSIVPMDDRASPQEALIQLRRAIDQGIRYVIGGHSSAVMRALSEAVAKHNAAHPKQSVLLLNHAAVAPELTNEHCNFWHFRFTANADMKLLALLDALGDDKQARQVFIIGQDYSYGRQLAASARQMLNQYRPHLRIVGDELHPLGRIKDFSPYISKIKASGADTVITGNWGADLTLLILAARDAGLKVNFYTFYAHVVGTPPAFAGEYGQRVRNISIYSPNIAPESTQRYIDDYKRRYDATSDPYTITGAIAIQMLVRAMRETRSEEPLQIAIALEEMRHDGFFGEVRMRGSDHQLLQPVFVDSLVPVNASKVRRNADGTAQYGFLNLRRVEAADTALPTRCTMQRPVP